MSATNDITGDRIVSRPSSELFRTNWDTVFGNTHTNKVYIEKINEFFIIIIDYHDNENCVLRLNREQFNELKQQIMKWSDSDFVSMP